MIAKKKKMMIIMKIINISQRFIIITIIKDKIDKIDETLLSQILHLIKK